MTHDDHVSEAMKRANPVPPGDFAGEPARSPDEMLAHVTAPARRRSHDRFTGVGPPRRRGFVVAVGTFALVIVLGFGSVLLFRSDPGAPTTPQTEGAPTTPIETVQSMFDAWNRGDVEAYLAAQDAAFVAATARSILEGGDDDSRPTPEEAEALIRDDFAYWFLIGTEWEVSECTTQPAPSGRGDQVDCQLTANSGFERAYGVPNDPKPVRFTVERGLIISGSANRIGRGVYPIAAAAFFAWVQESIDAGDLETSTVPCPTTAVYQARQGRVPSAECSQWIADHQPQWIATLEPTG